MDWTVFLLTHNQEEGQQYLTENNLTNSPFIDWTSFISAHNQEEGQYLTENNSTTSLYT